VHLRLSSVRSEVLEDGVMTKSEQWACCEFETSGKDPCVCPLCGESKSDVAEELSSEKEIRSILIEFLYIDITQCKRCQELRNRLEEVVSSLRNLLLETGIDISVRKKHIQTEAEARKVGLKSSPTIRLNGRDIQPDLKEKVCESCSEISGEFVNCRVWNFKGTEYITPPKGMLVDHILREIYAGSAQATEKTPAETDVPENLKTFFAAKRGEKTPKWDRRKS